MSYNTLVGMLVPQLARMNNTIETIDMMQYSIMGITNYSITGFVVGVAPSLVIFAGRIIFDYVTKGFAN